MGKKIKIRVKRPWIAYPGSTVQQNYAEDRDHGYLLWDVKGPSDFDVNFCELPNPRPFITLDWQGDLKTTLSLAEEYPKGSRFRIRSDKHIVQKDVSALTAHLKRDYSASEVTFRQDHKTEAPTLDTGTVKLIRDDLRNPEVLLKLLKDYYRGVKVTEKEWEGVQELVTSYVSNVGSDTVMRGVKWSLRSMKFDNLFCYGDGNEIDFSKLSGIVGIFGRNYSGKSSIVGSIMYSIFNASDRGSVKNKNICNDRKSFCYSRPVIKVGGDTYVIERQTVKQELKGGGVYAPTSLNLFKMVDGEAVDLNGEQRVDTEKTIRKLLGTSEDFLLTSVAAQGDTNNFIQHGSSKRSQSLSRFLDLDVCNSIFLQAKVDYNNHRALLKKMPDRDWELLLAKAKGEIDGSKRRLTELGIRDREIRDELLNLRSELTNLSGSEPVTRGQLDDQKKKVTFLTEQLSDLQSQLEASQFEVEEAEGKLKKIATVLSEHSLESLRAQYSAYQQMKSSVAALKSVLDTETATHDRQKRSLKILDEVPCGNQFPTCKFIKDAHKNLAIVDEQAEKVLKARFELDKARASLNETLIDDVLERISKLEKLEKLQSSTRLRVSELGTVIARLEGQVTTVQSDLDDAKDILRRYETTEDSKDNKAACKIKARLEALEVELQEVDNEKLETASNRGRAESRLEHLQKERRERRAALQQMKLYEIVYNGFNKKGIPTLIISSQLPVINAEMEKILNGIVGYTVEMEREGDHDRIEIYINYGDSRRPIELGSGMEKFIASIAMRVAMINVSTLPRSDMFIIDEGFGSLDDLSAEACNRLLVELKRYFRVIMVISHLDAIKDTADHILEITKDEKDSRVVYC